MELSEREITELTTLNVVVTVRNKDGSLRNLTGASYVAKFGREATVLTGTVTEIDATNGVVRVAFPAATGLAGKAWASLTMSQGGVTDTVWRKEYQVFPIV